MSVKKNAYPHNNFARTEDYLEELILWGSGERGRVPIDEANYGYEDLTVTATEAKNLTVPDDAVSAEIQIESDITAFSLTTTFHPAGVVRYKQNGTAPTANTGMALGNGDVLEVYGKTSLDLFKVIGIQANKSQILRVQYYKTAQETV